MITTSEAARRLGVSSRRVLKLIHNGVLDAQKHGGVWLVAEESVEQRLQTVRKRGGRPARGKGRNDVQLLLMNRSHAVAEVVYDRMRHEFVKAGSLADPDR
ncbi:MAG: helix-turn-helix domain-containing protein, partial [Eggerthellaceae bacterium]|nr:helix-turn-helix domain-containing protein [Eggerthellaceae bacterium]